MVHEENGKKPRNWRGKRKRSTKAFKEHWAYEGATEYPGMVAQELVFKNELKMECDLKKVKKDERKSLVHSLKKYVEEGSTTIKK